MKVSRIIVFTIVCCASFIALLGIYAFALFDFIMPKGETYNDPNNGLAVQLPGGWIKGNMMDSGILVFSKGENPFVFYEWGDYWQIIKPDDQRSSQETFDSYDRYIRELYKYSPTLKTIGGYEYYTYRIVVDDGTLLLAYHFDDGIEYKFSTLPESASDEYAFFRFLNFVSYPEGWSNHSMLSSSQAVDPDAGSFSSDLKWAFELDRLQEAADKVTLYIALLNLLFVLIMFLIPLVVCRLIIFKHCSGKKQAYLTALAITLITAAALAFSLYYTGLSLWFTLEAIALGLLTYKLIKPRKEARAIFETSAGGQASGEATEIAQISKPPVAENNTIETDLLQVPGVAAQAEPKDRNETAAAYCWHCGNQLRKGAFFCPKCGTNVREL